MASVFLSYARADFESAKGFVQALEACGHSVWWDQDLEANDQWLSTLEEHIDEVSHVVVLWTPRSAESRMVCHEASRAGGKLVPVLLEDTKLPEPFDQKNALDLRGWDGRVSAEPFQKLHRKLTGRRFPKPAPWIAAALTLGVAAAASAWVRVPTTADIDVLASGVQFRTHGDGPHEVLDSVRVKGLDLRGFDTLRLAEARISIADPARYDLQTDSYPPNAWSELPQGELVLKSRSETASLMITALGPGAGIGMDRLRTGAADISLTVPEPGSLSLRVRGISAQGSVLLPAEFLAVADSCVRQGKAWPYATQQVTLRIRLPREPRLMQFTAEDRGMLFGLELPSQASVLGRASVAIEEVTFLTQGALQPESTLAGPGQIRYPDRSARPVDLASGMFLHLSALRDFRLMEAALAEKALRVKLRGTAGLLRSGPPKGEKDRRLTWWRSF